MKPGVGCMDRRISRGVLEEVRDEGGFVVAGGGGGGISTMGKVVGN